MKKKKVIALLMAAAMVVSLAACGNSTASAPAEAPAAEEPAAEEPAAEEPAAEEAAAEAPAVEGGALTPCDITMWCIATESDSNRHAYEQSIADFQAAHPEINFTWEATQNEEYKTKIKAAVAANEMPDIFFTWGGGFLREFVEADRVYCVDDVYAKYASQIPEVMMGNHQFNGKYYAAPTTFNIVGMFTNMELLKEVGYDKVPGTYDELIACCDALVAKGIIPFGCSGKETWCVTEYLESIIEKNCGATALKDMYNGDAAWSNEDVINAVGIFQEMINKQYFDPAGIALSNDEVKANFIAGQYAFYINGTWNMSDMINAGVADKVQVAEFPVINAEKSKLGELIGGANDSLAVAASSEHPDVAAEVAFELAKGITQYGYLDGNGLPAWTPDYDTSALHPLTLAVADIVQNSSQNVLFGDTFLSADDANIYLDYVSQIYAAAIDGKAFAEGLDSDLQ